MVGSWWWWWYHTILPYPSQELPVNLLGDGQDWTVSLLIFDSLNQQVLRKPEPVKQWHRLCLLKRRGDETLYLLEFQRVCKIGHAHRWVTRPTLFPYLLPCSSRYGTWKNRDSQYCSWRYWNSVERFPHHWFVCALLRPQKSLLTENTQSYGHWRTLGPKNGSQCHL